MASVGARFAVVVLAIAVGIAVVSGALLVAGMLPWGWFVGFATTSVPLLVWVAVSTDDPRYEDPDFFDQPDYRDWRDEPWEQ